MAHWNNLKTAIANVIKTNGNQEITGRLLQNVLNNIVSSVGENATFAGIATLTTNPGTPDGPVFYLATQPGVYSNFDGLENTRGECLILKYDGAWSSIVVNVVTNSALSNLLGLAIDASTFVSGQWVGNGENLTSNNNSSYLRNPSSIAICGKANTIISLRNSTGDVVRIASLSITLKFRNKSKQNVPYSYISNGQFIQLSAEASELYIHGTTAQINSINGYSFLGLISIDLLVQRFDERITQNTQDITQNTQDIEALNNTINGGSVNYITGAQLGVYPNHAYVGSTLGDNPISNSTNSALGRIDVSGLEGTHLYITKDGTNVFDGITWKFFGSDGNRLASTQSGSSSTNDRGYLVPSGAVILGLHKLNNYIDGDIESYLSSLHINNISSSQQGFDERITQNTQDITQNTQDITQNTQDITQNAQDIEALNNTITELQNHIEDLSVSDNYKSTLKILFIGSSFGVDTINEVGNICASFEKNVILGNAYIGAATLQTFINRYDSDFGVTYYKWKYKATKWQIYNGNTGEWLDTDSNITDEGEKPNDSVLLPWLLADEAWDFIILQNGAYQSPYQDQSAFWTKGEDGVITNNIVQTMINKCKKSCLYSNPVFGMNMTWAFSVYHTISTSHGPAGADDDKWLSYGSNQKERQLGMWNNIATNYKACIENCEDIKFVIPSGTAVQNARANSGLRQSTIYTSANPAPPTISQAEAITDLDNISSTYPFMDNSTNWKNKTDFTRDSIHADFGITRYIIAATMFQAFIAKVLNLDIENCTYRIAQGSGNYREQLCTPVTDDNFNDIVTCVKNAINSPYAITE